MEQQVISKRQLKSHWILSYQAIKSSPRPFLSDDGVDFHSAHCSFHHLPVSFLEMHPSPIQGCGWCKSSGTRRRTPGAWTYPRPKLCDTGPQILQEERERVGSGGLPGGGLNNRTYALPVLEAGSSRSRRGLVWFLLKPLSLACLLSGSSHGPPCVCMSVLISSCKDTSHTGLGPTHMTS